MRYETCMLEWTEDMELANHEAWFANLAHPFENVNYFSASWIAENASHGFPWGAEFFSLPCSRGLEMRNYKGVVSMLSPIIVTDEVEIKEREAKFREKMLKLPYEFGDTWEQYKLELIELFRPFKEFDYQRASTIELQKKLLELRTAALRMMEIHMWGLYGSFALYMMFEDLCKELFGMDSSSPELHAMVRGFDNKSFQCERELWHLSQRVLDLDLSSTFKLPSPEVAPVLRESEKGRTWLGKLDEFLKEYGWRCERCFSHDTPTWLEDPRYAIAKVQSYLKLGREYNPIEKMKKIAEERESTIANIMPKVPEDHREAFTTLLKGAQYADLFSEEHDLYCEMQTDALGRLWCLELGKRYVQAGAIDNVEDIFLLGLDEVRKFAWSPERYRLQPIIEDRRAKGKAELEKGLPRFVSEKMSMEEAIQWMMKSRDPIIMKENVGEMPQPKEELKADLWGAPASPGIAEGPARVIVSADQLIEVQPGEILVAPTTSIAWTSAFALVKGVILDSGGSLCHGAIVAREYGIPCVTNTFTGTATIKTGQKIKMDGMQGAIYFL
jgi:pyruvate,water dikinase